ncbi:hypothetical protein ACOMHN_020871 [Nucella lapillus]
MDINTFQKIPHDASSSDMTVALGSLGSLLYPYIIPMLLGRTFDLYRAQVGVDIFSQDTISKPIRIHRSYVTSDFRLIRNESEARSFLGLTEDVSLRVKAGVLKVAASGDYLKDVQKRENYVEILVKSTYETFTETLHGSNKPIQDWDLFSPNSLGTHFVRSITYGGLLLASFRLYVKNTAQKSLLEEFLASHVSFNEVRVSLKKAPGEVQFVREMNSFEEKLQKMMYQANSTMGSDLSVRIKYYSTVTAPRVPQDLASFLSVLEDFPFQAKKTNGGFGVPVSVELLPLHELSARMLALKPSTILDGFLGDLDSKFDDLLLTHKSLKSLSTKDGVDDDYGKKCEMRDLGTEVHDKLDVFKQVINNLNTASPEAQGLGERAIQAYEQKSGPDSYFSRFKRLQKDMAHPARGSSGDVRQGITATQVGQVLNEERLLTQFGDLAELAMANGLCTSLNKLSGSFLTLRRNCSVSDPVPRTCSQVCGQLQVGSNYRARGQCASVVAAQVHTPVTLGGVLRAGGEGKAAVVGAQTANLGRSACGRSTCFKEYCCCRLARFSNSLL